MRSANAGSRPGELIDSRNDLYQRDYAAALGVIRLRLRRTRERSLLPRVCSRWNDALPRWPNLSAMRFGGHLRRGRHYLSMEHGCGTTTYRTAV